MQHKVIHTGEQSPPSKEAATFSYTFDQLEYSDIASARVALESFLRDCNINKTYTDKLLLSLSEILTNLIKHPEQKAERVSSKVIVDKYKIMLDVADNSSPFLHFDEQCKKAYTRNSSGHISLKESGYGLFCILQQHKNITYTPAPQSHDQLNHFTISDSMNELDPDRKPDTKIDQKKVIFLVDDDPIALKLQARMLSEGYNVIAFDSAQDVIAAFKNLRPDLIISDLEMPDIDGAELRRRLMQLKFGNEIPFIFLSGLSDNQHKPHINQLGIDDFLCKPIEKDHLLAVVSRLLKRSEQIRKAVDKRVSSGITDLLKPALPEAWQDVWQTRVFNIMADAGGGDFTLHRETDDSLLAILADVMGHGYMAKFFAFAYAGYLRSIFNMQETADASTFFSTLSNYTQGDQFLESMIMTCQSLQLFKDGRAKIFSAGHPQPILIRESGCTDINVSGPLPGLMPDAQYDSAEITLAPGEKLLMATDGFFGVFDSDESARKELLPYLNSLAGHSLDDICARLWMEFGHRAGDMSDASDDVTLIMFEYGGP